MADINGPLPPPNYRYIQLQPTVTCNESLERDSCYLSNVENGEADAIAAIRMVMSCLSILGAMSIVIWAFKMKQVCSPKVHPIFVLSLADTILSVLYLIGGTLWLRRAPSRVGCFAISLPTVIMECVTVNLTVVYALLAYSGIKRKTLNNILASNRDNVWSPLKSLITYLIAWVTPIVIVMFFFGIVAGQTFLVAHTNDCSCYCLPIIGNVVPLVQPRDEESAIYSHAVVALLVTYGAILVIHYLVGFILLVIIYYKLLKYIKKMRTEYENTRADPYSYGATGVLLVRGQSKARKRVVYFISVFVVNGFFNFFLSFVIMLFDGYRLAEDPYVIDDPFLRVRPQNSWEKLYAMAFIFQSLTVPMQGFLNALVYGWTREDFLTVMAYSKNGRPVSTIDTKEENPKLELEESAEFNENAFTDKQVDLVKKLTEGSKSFVSSKKKTFHQIQSSIKTGLSGDEED